MGRSSRAPAAVPVGLREKILRGAHVLLENYSAYGTMTRAIAGSRAVMEVLQDIVPAPTDADYRARARTDYQRIAILRIDGDAVVETFHQGQPAGAYVQAWVWVPRRQES